LICMFRLQLPSKWPEYCSFLKVELVEVRNEGDDDDDSSIEHIVRFYLNGERINCKWDDDAKEAIPLQELAHKIKTVGAQ
jgi:hypothetical protein